MAGIDPDSTPKADDKKESKSALYGKLADSLFDLHEMMMAGEERSVLLVLQGTDASGKSGVVKHVVRLVDPAGVRVAGFVEPDDEEEEHHFLWRIRQELPSPGSLGVFDRSHYEDILVPVVDEEFGIDEYGSRVADINEFEEELVDGGMSVVKCFLHVSYDEQRRRFERRLKRDDKRWKFKESDLETRERWDQYQAAYSDAISQTNTTHAPWYVVPSDHKWYRNWAVAHILIETMTDMDLEYPQPNIDVEKMLGKLESRA